MQENFESYKRELDRVRLTEDGKRSLAESLGRRTRTVHRPRRMMAGRIAAVAAAVCLLAGTAVAAYMNRVAVSLADPDGTGTSTEGYLLQVEHTPIPLESLSAQALEEFASGDAADHISRYEGVPAGCGTWYFDSWAAAEAFLGLDLGRNTLLEQYPESWLSPYEAWGCVLGCAVLDDGKVPAEMELLAEYRIEGCDVTVSASLEVDTPAAEALLGRPLGQWEALMHAGSEEGRYTVEGEQYTSEEYTTPSGLSAVIVNRSGTQAGPAVGESGRYDLQFSRAYFIKNNAYYSIDCKGAGHEQETALLKEILDAYE